jgi:hypothetical protein
VIFIEEFICHYGTAYSCTSRPYVVDKTIPPPPPPERQVIIERLPTPPPKPRTVVFEKWLPYKTVKRPVLLQKAPPLTPMKPTRNIIIEYEPSKAYTVRRVIEEGVFRVDPHQYATYQSQGDGDVRMVDRIDDLPPPSEDLLRVINEYKLSSASAPEYNRIEHYSRPMSNIDRLVDLSRSTSSSNRRFERIVSPGDYLSYIDPIPASSSRAQSNNGR